MFNAEGVITRSSPYSVPETLDRLEALLRAKNISVFVRVDHSGEAEKAGLSMPPTQLLIFGNPKGGTPLMLASPLVAIDLPLKLLVAEDANGKCTISYNSPQYLQMRHSLSNDLIQNIAIIEALATEAAA